MKDSLFEMLLNLFETSLSQLQERSRTEETDSDDTVNPKEDNGDKVVYAKLQNPTSTRVVTYSEQIRLSKASYQFLIKMRMLEVINAQEFEMIINQLQFSESQNITLQETKWTIRNALASTLDENQLTFLDLILYQTEDEYLVH